MLRAELTAFGQQNQFRCRIGLPSNAVGKCYERLHGRRNLAQCCYEIPLRRFNALPDGDFLVRFQQPPLADVLQIQAYQVDVFARSTFLGLLDFFLFLFDLFLDGEPLIGERLRLVVPKQALGRDGEGPLLIGFLALVHFETESVRALSPVEDVSWFGRIVPFDERLAPAPAGRGRRCGRKRESIRLG